MLSNIKIMKTKPELSFFIVDDDPIYNSFIKNYLESKGFTNLRMFFDGSSCIERLYQLPDIIILDFQMGELNGLDVLKQIREFDPDINVIFLSGQKNVDVAVNSLKYGSIDYIIKDDETLINLTKVIDKIFYLKNIESKKVKKSKFIKFTKFILVSLFLITLIFIFKS
jgi:DNA-binding NtrC family response regulator